MPATSVGIHPVYAVVGDNRFLRNEALQRILQVLGDETDTPIPARFEGAGAELAEVLDEVRTPSLWGTHRVVIVDDADTFITTHRKALERYGSSPAVGGSLILLCKTLPRNTRLHSIITKHGSVLTCDAPKGRAVVGWLTTRAQTTYGKRLSPPGAQRLHEHIDDSPGLLDAELAKLTAYVGNRDEITEADIDALTGHHRGEKVFAVIDAVLSHDAPAAFRHWEQVLATDRAAPDRAIGGLAWSVRQMLGAKRAWEGGESIGELASRMRTDPSVLRRRLEDVSTEQLEEQQRDLLSADLAVKTGTSTIDLAVEKFIVKHAIG